MCAGRQTLMQHAIFIAICSDVFAVPPYHAAFAGLDAFDGIGRQYVLGIFDQSVDVVFDERRCRAQ